MENNIFSKMTAEEQDRLWMFMIFYKDKIIEKTEQWAKEAEEAGMTLTEYLESISPRDMAMRNDILTKRFGIPMEKESEFHCGFEESGGNEEVKDGKNI